MSQVVTLNGIQYTVPAYNDSSWAQGNGNLSQYLAAIASATLQPTGGAFTLTAETDFGPNYGLKALYLKSETANPATGGVVRLSASDSIKWRNAANNADIAVAKDGSDNLTYNSSKVLLSGAVVNADIASGAAIAYSKLMLTGSVVNADIATGAAIGRAKLDFGSGLVNSDIATGAAIAVNKLAALSVSVVPVTDASGFLSSSSTTATELGYLHGVTSAIQTQINGKQATLTVGQLPGTTTNDDAAAGKVGEWVQSAVAGAAGASTSNWGNLTSISLTAGDWDVTGVVVFRTNGATLTGNAAQMALSQYSGSTTTDHVVGDNELWGLPPTATAQSMDSVPAWRVKLASTATIYIKAVMYYSAGAPAYNARISARRVR